MGKCIEGYIFSGLSEDNETIIEWGRCLPECPAEEVRPVCQELPQFPALGDGIDRSVNYTTNIEGWMDKTRHITHGVSIILWTFCLS